MMRTTLNVIMQAARYQMIIMFIISATTSVGAVATLYMASSYCIDANARLRMDFISKRDKANAWNRRLGRKIAQVIAIITFRALLWPTIPAVCIGANGRLRIPE